MASSDREETLQADEMKLQDHGMATALSMDDWSAPDSSKCVCKDFPDLSVNFICMHPHKSGRSNEVPNKPVAARFQEVFIDLVGMHCSSLDAASRHVLDDRFDSFLGKGEREFKNAVMQLMNTGTAGGMTIAARKTPAFQALEQMLRTKMGYRNCYAWYNRMSNMRNSSSLKDKGTKVLSDMLGSFMRVAEPSLEEDEEDPRIAKLKRAMHDIETNWELRRKLSFCGVGLSQDELASLLREHLSSEQVDLFVDAIYSPSFPDVSSKIAAKSLLRIPGHVCVCNASVCDIFCDAFLCPGAIVAKDNAMAGTIKRQWYEKTVSNSKLEEYILPYDFQTYEQHDRVITHRNWPWKEFESGRLAPAPFFVGGEVVLESSGCILPSEEQHVRALMETVKQFTTVALMELRANQPKPRAGRERYLLAVPVLGTGGGFAGDLTGQVVEGVLRLLAAIALREEDVDMVLVCADEATYAHAQSIRSTLVNQQSQSPSTSLFPCFQLMTNEMRAYSLQLAKLASSGHLALFLGAGVSIGSGLPGWISLLHVMEDLFTLEGKPEERSLGNKTNWDPLQMADRLSVICASQSDRNGLQQPLKQRICNYIIENARHPGLLLSLLVSLPCQSIVTQNYDRLIEQAFSCWNVADPSTSKPLSVIPYCPRRKAQHWLLKMHGCCIAPDEIIITGEDYSNFESSRLKALGRLVQASLMTKHLLFVGFSLTDPNYLHIIDQVRNALRPSINDDTTEVNFADAV